MCDPVSLTVLTIATTGMQIHQHRQQGKFQEGTAKYNARLAENRAQEVRNAGVEEENLQRRRTAELQSKQRAQLGAAGVDIGFGSALDIQNDAAILGEADALRIRNNTESQASAIEAGAELTRREGAFARRAANTRAITTGLQGATQVAGIWYKSNSSGGQGIATAGAGG